MTRVHNHNWGLSDNLKAPNHETASKQKKI